MNQHTPVKSERKKRIDCRTTRLAISIPLNGEPEAYANAIMAVRNLKDHLPAGTLIEVISEGLSKMPAA